MDAIMEKVVAVNDFINGIVWGVPVLLLILGVGIYYTIRLGFVQFRHPFVQGDCC